MTAEPDLVEQAMQRFIDAFPPPETATIEELRRCDDELWGSLTRDDAIAEPVDAGGVPCVWVSVPGVQTDRVLLWFHGGGYMLGSAHGWRSVAAEMARAAGCRVLNVGFRLAPEHPFPAALDDAFRAYVWAAELVGPVSTAVGGASGGGNLALALVQAIRARGVPDPAAAVAVSPWTDMTLASASLDELDGVDPFVSKVMLERLREAYLAGHDPNDPLVSPVNGDLGALPPTLVLVGSRETLLDDSRRYSAAAAAAGSPVELDVYEGMFHLWFMFSSMLPEARTAIERIATFVRAHTTPTARR